MTYTEAAVALMLGSLAATGLLEFIDPRSDLGDFIFWPQHYFHYFLKFGANNPIAPRIMFALIVALLSLLAFVVMRAFKFGVWITRGVTPAIVAILPPMICWAIARRGYLGIQGWFGLFLAAYCVACVLYFPRGRFRFPLWTWLTLWTICLCWWVIVFHSALDPINLIDPTFAFIAGVVWSLSLRPARETA